MLEADPNLEYYHGYFRRSTKTLRDIYALTTNDKLKCVLDQIFRDRHVSPIQEVIPIETPTQEQIQAYQDKQNRKLERYQELAEKNEVKANDLWDRSHKLGDMIPFGQPILIGHHSEGRHRRHLDKIQNTTRKAIETGKKSEYYQDKVKNVLNPRGISADDPEAIIKLNSEIDELEKIRIHLKTTYEFKAGVKDYEEGSEHYRKLELESVTRKIRDKKKRIDDLRAVKNIPDVDTTINNVRVFTDKEDNRLKISFPCKPNPEIISKLKHSGFHWSPFNKTWQRMIGNYAIVLAEQIQKEFKP